MLKNGLTSIFLKEIQLANDLFVDPITEEILREINEPTTFTGLLIRSCELLRNYEHPDSQDLMHSRIRGYERFAGMIYKDLTRAIKAYRDRNYANTSRIEMSPYSVWRALLDDPSKKAYEGVNPLLDIKEHDVVTYVGEGGRSKDAFVKDARAYHKSDFGVIGEATVDSGDVGVSAYLSADPAFADLRGRRTIDDKISISNVMSVSANIAPFSLTDDPKRVNFVNIMSSHIIAAKGYHAPIIRTGYEYVVAKRTGKMFAWAASQPGKVISVTNKGMIVEYEDGSREGCRLGIQYGRAEGSYYPHPVVPRFKEGDKFEKDDVLAYNSNFFEPDIYANNELILKTTATVKTAVLESQNTFEDSSAISSKMASKLVTESIKVVPKILKFDQGVLDVKKPGIAVKPKDHLFIIQEAVTASMNLSEEEIETLKHLSKQAPKAKYDGVIERIEVLYKGELEDMSPTLRALAEESNKQLMKEAKDSDGNQMKSVVGEVLDYDVFTESGDEVEAIFGFKSIYARIVMSPILIGMINTLSKVIAKKAYEIYSK